MPVRKALVVGINDYKVRPLRSCVNDAEEVSGVLAMKEYGFQVTTLLDQHGSRRTILSELSALLADNPDFAVFYFAGHGISTHFSTYLVTADTDPIDIGIDLDYLRRVIRNNTTENTTVLIVLDCCHSGAATPRGLLLPDSRDIRNSDVDQSLITLGNGKVVVAACQASEVAFEEPSIMHGVFTRYLLEGLYGDAADAEGKVTIPNLYDHVSKRFEKVTGQTPVFRGDIVGRIVLGEGLVPRDRSDIPGDQAVEIEAQAQKMMNEYIQATSTDIETWKITTYRDACAMLLPKLQWFERQVTKYPKLKARPGFKAAYATAHSKLADLGHLMEGLATKDGVVKMHIGSGTLGKFGKLAQKTVEILPTKYIIRQTLKTMKKSPDLLEAIELWNSSIIPTS